jgi:hypothetical protein
MPDSKQSWIAICRNCGKVERTDDWVLANYCNATWNGVCLPGIKKHRGRMVPMSTSALIVWSELSLQGHLSLQNALKTPNHVSIPSIALKSATGP